MYDDEDEGLDQMIGGVNMANGDDESAVALSDGLGSVNLKREKEQDMKTLEELLTTTVEARDKDKNPIKIIPEFRVAVQGTFQDGVKIIIHPIGYNGETLDFLVKGNTLEPVN